METIGEGFCYRKLPLLGFSPLSSNNMSKPESITQTQALLVSSVVTVFLCFCIYSLAFRKRNNLQNISLIPELPALPIIGALHILVWNLNGKTCSKNVTEFLQSLDIYQWFL